MTQPGVHVVGESFVQYKTAPQEESRTLIKLFTLIVCDTRKFPVRLNSFRQPASRLRWVEHNERHEIETSDQPIRRLQERTFAEETAYRSG